MVVTGLPSRFINSISSTDFPEEKLIEAKLYLLGSDPNSIVLAP